MMQKYWKEYSFITKSRMNIIHSKILIEIDFLEKFHTCDLNFSNMSCLKWVRELLTPSILGIV